MYSLHRFGVLFENVVWVSGFSEAQGCATSGSCGVRVEAVRVRALTLEALGVNF